MAESRVLVIRRTTKHLTAVRSMADKCLLNFAAHQVSTRYSKGIVFPPVFAILLVMETNTVLVYTDKALIADRNAVTVPCQVLDDGLCMIHTGLAVDHPVFLHDLVEYPIHFTGSVTQILNRMIQCGFTCNSTQGLVDHFYIVVKGPMD